MKRFGLPLAATGLMAFLMAFLAMGGQASALTCSGTILTFASGNTTSALNLSAISGGNCVQLQDKLIGNFTSIFGVQTGTTFTGSLDTVAGEEHHQFSINSPSTFLTTGISYSFEVLALNPLLPIDRLDADFTQPVGLSTLTKSTNVAGIPNILTENKNGALVTSCPGSPLFDAAHGFECGKIFTPRILDFIVTDTLLAGNSGTVTSITDSIVEVRVPEPGTLLLLGASLVIVGVAGRRRHHR